MNTVPDLYKTTAMAATGRTKAAAGVRVKLLPHGFSIDHPDSELGEQLMADALGVADRDAMHGILRQLVKASVQDERPDEVNLAFMISMVKSIKPRDSVEAMLVAQMVSVHVMAMRCAYHLANAEDIARQDSAGRALGRLARTFPAQIEALNRHRNNGEPAITVQNVSVQDGGKAIVGNVTQHASVIVSDNSPAPAVTDARMVSTRNTGPMLASPRCGAKIRSGGSCRSPAVRGKRRCRMHGGALESGAPRGNQNARKHGLFTRNAIAERRQIQALLGEARKLVEEIK